MTEPLFHHTFTPIKLDGDRRIVAPEAEWDEVHEIEFACGHIRRRVEIGGDLFEPWTGPIHATDGKRMWRYACNGGEVWLNASDVRRRVFDLNDDCPHVDFFLNTTRLREAAELMPGFYDPDGKRHPRHNLIPGTTVTTQREADDRLPWLLRLPAAKRWVRYVPGKERVDFHMKRQPGPVCRGCADVAIEGWCEDDGDGKYCLSPDLLTISGSLAEPTNLDHVRDVIAQCQTAGVRVWVERLGPCPQGADPEEWPADLRVRETI